ncbi:beta-glucosidase B [Colletotrichum liriopes]|uniref:beta-glucosidase n=1 Tax=Colletotrichum liriopes TaxID=708192 RepID=A0AA37H0M2_9PEZI|nr:beta-glucosidase B [Colletotrichum liriopes]
MSAPEILAALSLDEKLSLLAGGSQWRTAAIDRLGVPTLKVSDGSSGARGEIFGENVPAAFLPCGVSLGATWDVELMQEIGQLLADECKSKSASVSLAPTMCIHRHPLGGRNFESFSEDPFFTGKLAAAHIRGLQSRGVGATPKHFVANDQETKRFKVNAHIDPRALREVYLLPFQMAVREADPWCMMTTYNKVNGHHCDASKELLTDIARDEWEWDGVFMSDWGGTTSTVDSINHGLDLEMPGPSMWRSMEALEKPLRDGAINMHRVDDSARRVLALLEKTGRHERPAPQGCMFRDHASEEQQGRTAPAAEEESISTLAVVGPNAKRVVAGGGGSSYIKAPSWTSVHDSIEREFAQYGTKVRFHEGSKLNRYLPTPSPVIISNPDTGNPGACIDWHLSHDLSTETVAKTHADDLYFMSFGDVPKEVGRPVDFSFRVRAILKPLTTGTHHLSLASIGPAKLFVDNEKILHQSGAFEERSTLFFTYGSGELRASLFMEAGREYRIRVDCLSHDRQLDAAIAPLMEPMEEKFQGFRLGYEEWGQTDLPAEAAQLAEGCDAAIVVVGRDKE